MKLRLHGTFFKTYNPVFQGNKRGDREDLKQVHSKFKRAWNQVHSQVEAGLATNHRSKYSPDLGEVTCWKMACGALGDLATT